MNSKKKLFMVSILIVIVVLSIGVAFAYYVGNVLNAESASTVVSSSGSMTIEYLPVDVSGNSLSIADNYISAASISPSPSPFATKYFKVKGTNSTSKTMAYVISIVIDTNTFSDNAIRYIIIGTNTSGVGTLIADSTEKVGVSGTTSVVIGTGNFPSGTDMYHSYTIKFYFPDTDTDQSADMQKDFKVHLEVSSTQA